MREDVTRRPSHCHRYRTMFVINIHYTTWSSDSFHWYGPGNSLPVTGIWSHLDVKNNFFLNNEYLLIMEGIQTWETHTKMKRHSLFTQFPHTFWRWTVCLEWRSQSRGKGASTDKCILTLASFPHNSTTFCAREPWIKLSKWKNIEFLFFRSK